jgi:peptidoglycan/xylan/chitin deacetylase (PgdA/CDA1 family)
VALTARSGRARGVAWAVALLWATLPALPSGASPPTTARPSPVTPHPTSPHPAYPPYVRVLPPLPALPTPAPGIRTVALTFDDGPDPRWTPQILALLAQHHVHAVFCEVGRLALAHPDLVRQVVAQGHVLCNHTYDHPITIGSMTDRQVTAQLQRTEAVLHHAARLTGMTPDQAAVPHLFRIPYGHWSATTNRTGRRLNLTALGWNVDPHDYERPGRREILRRELAQLKPGSIVLNHDGGGDRGQTVRSLALLLDWLDAHQWQVVLPVAS